MNSTKILDEAIGVGAERWTQCLGGGSLASNLNLRDRATIFGPPFRKALLAKFPTLRAANDEVLLLVMAEGIAKSETVSRDKIERALGIIVPPTGECPLSTLTGRKRPIADIRTAAAKRPSQSLPATLAKSETGR